MPFGINGSGFDPSKFKEIGMTYFDSGLPTAQNTFTPISPSTNVSSNNEASSSSNNENSPFSSGDGWVDSLNNAIDIFSQMGDYSRVFTLQELLKAYQSGDYLAMQRIISGSPWLSKNLTPEIEKWLDNMISKQNTDESRDWEEYMRDTATISQADQLKQLGLSSSGVLQTGSLSHSGVSTASNSRDNTAMNRYNQRMSLARSLIGMTSALAGAGVHGASLGLARKASGIVSSAAAHSGLKAMQVTRYYK